MSTTSRAFHALQHPTTRRGFALLGLGAVATTLAACSGPVAAGTSGTAGAGAGAGTGSPSTTFPNTRWVPSTEPKEKPTTPRTIGFINNLGSSSLAGAFAAALGAAAKTENMTVATTSPNGDFSKAITQMNQLLQRGVSGIYSTPIAPEMTPPDLAAMAKGAMVLQWNQGPATTMLSSLQYDGGYRVGVYTANYIKTKMNGKAKVALITQDFDQTLKPRTQGFDDAMKAAGMTDLVVAHVTPPQNPGATQAQGLALSNTLLQQHPDLDVIAATGDDLALGAATAFRSAGRSAASVMTVGIDGTAPGLDAIQKGDSPFKATVAVNFPLVAYLPGRLFGRWADGLNIPQFQVFNYATIDSASAAAQLAKDTTLEELPNVYDKLVAGDDTYVTPLGSIDYATRGAYYDGTVPVKLPALAFTENR